MVLANDGWKLQVVVPPDAIDFFSQALEPFCSAVVTLEVEEHVLWRVEGYAETLPPEETISAALAIAAVRAGIPEPEMVCIPVPVVDWVAETQRAFQPLHVGRYFVQPSHYDGRPPTGAIAITLDAGAAFGTGEHASTRGCLLALDALAKSRRVRKPLDLGCGSGILSIAIAATWRCRVMATDIDPVAVAVTRTNAGINRQASRIRALCGNGLAMRELSRDYDLIVGNILARPLVAFSAPIRRRLRRGGLVILSGLLARQEAEVRAAYRRQGMRLVRRIAIDGWHTLVVAR